MTARLRTLLLALALLGTSAETFAVEPKMPSRRDRCPVCGMFVYPYPEWLAVMIFADDTQLYFDGAKDLLRYYFSLPTATDSRTRDDLAAVYVTDYYSTRLLPVDQVFLVLGSDVYGPMGRELIPVAGATAAQTFAHDHDGTQVISFDQLTPQHLPSD